MTNRIATASVFAIAWGLCAAPMPSYAMIDRGEAQPQARSAPDAGLFVVAAVASNRNVGGGAQAGGSRQVRSNANANINRNANINVNRNVNVNVDRDYHHDWDDYHPIATAAAITAAAVVTAAVVGSIVHSVPPSCSTVIVNGISYSQCGSTWYQPQYAGTTVQYIVVNPPR